MLALLRLIVLLLPLWAGAQSSYDTFFEAVRKDTVSTVSRLLSLGFDPNTLNEKGNTGLLQALFEPSLKVAHELLAHPKLDVNKVNQHDESALMVAALRGHEDIVAKLLARQADVNKTGWTPLHYAAASGQVKIMRMLIEQHAFLDAESPNGTTPLMMAAGYGNGAAVKLLLDEGALPALKNQLGIDALGMARLHNRPDAIRLLSPQPAEAAKAQGPSPAGAAGRSTPPAAPAEPTRASAAVQAAPPKSTGGAPGRPTAPPPAGPQSPAKNGW
jgi:ankyrin repeat protein